MTDINLARVRSALPARREPHWRYIKEGCHLGYRKMPTGVETWVARFYERQSNGTAKRYFKPLGRVSTKNDYSIAEENAREWFQQCERGVPESCTVKYACEQYIADLRKRRPAADDDTRSAADNAQTILKTYVYGDEDAEENPSGHNCCWIGKIKLDELRYHDVQSWLDALVDGSKRTRKTANRILRSFKAALNFAYERARLVTSDFAWRGIKQFDEGDGRRDVYLTKEQRTAILSAASADLAALLRGFMYTGCRPGELAKARVRDLNVRTGVLTLSTSKGRGGKVRSRPVPLSGERLEFFKLRAKDKLPAAFLMTHANGERWIRHEWSREIDAIRKAIPDLPADLVAYHFRHSVISDWLAAGVPVADVAQTVGTSITMIQKHYKQFIKNNDLADKLAAVDIV